MYCLILNIMNSVNIEIENIKKKFFIERLRRELDTLDCKCDRGVYIGKIYNDLTKTRDDMGSIFADAINDVYAKKWNRLPNYHKIQKIREYLNVKYPDEKQRNEIDNKLTEMINNGTLNSCKFVDYDSTTHKINKINVSKTEKY